MSIIIKTCFTKGFFLKTSPSISIIRSFTHILSPEHKIIQETCREFAKKELAPIAAQLDNGKIFPKSAIQKLAQMGFLALGVNENYYGMGCDTLALAIAVEELSRGCASTGVIISIHNSLYANLINRCGTDEQKNRFLKPLNDGILGCFALSEPNAGSNVANIETKARKDGNGWIINGTKSWVTSSHEGNNIIVFANVDTKKNYRGITAFIVEKNTPGVNLGAKEDLIGIRALSCCNVTFEDVRIPNDNVLGEIGNGFKIAMTQLDQARIGISAQALGIAQAALDCAVSYSLQRQAFNRPIAELPAVQNRLAEMAVKLEGARLLTWKAAVEYDTGNRSCKHSSIAKFAASTCANFVADNCIQILGGMGLVKDFPAERHYRDARVTQIYGGVTDVQKIIIAKELIKEYS